MSSRLLLLRLRSAARCSSSSDFLSQQLTRFNSPVIGTLVQQALPIRSFTSSHTLQDEFNVQDEQDFRDKVTSVTDKPIVVEFHATWCGPCKQLMPRLEKRIATTQNKVDLAKVDIDDLPDLAMEYGVNAVPSVIAFLDGKIVDKFVGVKDEDEIDVFIKKLTK